MSWLWVRVKCCSPRLASHTVVLLPQPARCQRPYIEETCVLELEEQSSSYVLGLRERSLKILSKTGHYAAKPLDVSTALPCLFLELWIWRFCLQVFVAYTEVFWETFAALSCLFIKCWHLTCINEEREMDLSKNIYCKLVYVAATEYGTCWCLATRIYIKEKNKSMRGHSSWTILWESLHPETPRRSQENTQYFHWKVNSISQMLMFSYYKISGQSKKGKKPPMGSDVKSG